MSFRLLAPTPPSRLDAVLRSVLGLRVGTPFDWLTPELVSEIQKQGGLCELRGVNTASREEYLNYFGKDTRLAFLYATLCGKTELRFDKEDIGKSHRLFAVFNEYSTLIGRTTGRAKDTKLLRVKSLLYELSEEPLGTSDALPGGDVDSINALTNSLRLLPNLSSFTYSTSYTFPTDRINVLLQNLRQHCKQLTTLVLANCNLGGSIADISNTIGNMTGLKSLDLERCNISPLEMQTLFQRLEEKDRLNQLEVLRMAGNIVKNYSFKEASEVFIKYIPLMVNLNELSMEIYVSIFNKADYFEFLSLLSGIYEEGKVENLNTLKIKHNGTYQTKDTLLRRFGNFDVAKLSNKMLNAMQ